MGFKVNLKVAALVGYIQRCAQRANGSMVAEMAGWYLDLAG